MDELEKMVKKMEISNSGVDKALESLKEEIMGCSPRLQSYVKYLEGKVIETMFLGGYLE